ncbi:MAG: HAD-IA family hydrolase [Actinobacteria bacterium]|nr:HAD-IA family hydrolase [Actinomycetota bacterium]
MTLRALVFDFDGLILDTEGVVMEAWRVEYERHGAPFDGDAFVRTNVGSIRGQPGYVDEYDELERLIGRPVDREEIQSRRITHHERLLASLVPNPGVIDWITQSAGAGLALAIASSSPRSWVVPLLQRHGLEEHFSVVATRTEVGEVGKPDPAVYLHALGGLGVHGGEAVALEDSPAGVTAAKAAGLFAVAVPSEMTRVLDFSEADLVVDSLAAFTLDDLLARLRS